MKELNSSTNPQIGQNIFITSVSRNSGADILNLFLQ
ncbi:hypothetical protein [Neobacillus sp. PS2-9]